MQVLREYKGNNASSKSALLGKTKNEDEDHSIVFLQVIPYPTLLHESKLFL